MTLNRRTALASLAAAAGAVALPTTASAAVAPADAAPAGTGRHRPLFADDFSDGFATEGPGARWTHLAGLGPVIGRDATATTSEDGLRVESAGTHPVTGEPAFSHTVGQNDPSGFPGTLDHVKWLVYADHTASSGHLGFEVRRGDVLSCAASMTGTLYGTGGHPFGLAVHDPQDDLRLAMTGMPLQDEETGVAFDFFVTNSRVYAFYERLPHNRGELGNYAAFLYTVPVARRRPDSAHRFRITYDRSRGVVRWVLDHREVFRVDRIGHRLPSRRYMMLDHGGEEQLVEPRQLACGMGMFSILDGSLPGRSSEGLVRLTAASDHYYDPVAGEPVPQTFLDDDSAEAHRLFGQGAGLRVGDFAVTRRRRR
ncbi:DUF6081 family protein [Nocardiopsis aegyptia]|uniref:DUF6081 family protein n=1 Tax=Nocardiopsis aegyptia TaxID=220378 RepID=UPI003670CA6A